MFIIVYYSSFGFTSNKFLYIILLLSKEDEECMDSST